ncbi:MAG: single-stranded DNA-binding protein [Prevotella salivae]|uniref:single-stranded DNA-binding protein n=1 Tax=Segatella salivae TaxID=228604 RepID=UPI001CB121F5|nr:single-stranded DNA-binding protein [Segatella salivae]MBF1543629.1 single-stranded DNA-binding protein [Segatella salivae]
MTELTRGTSKFRFVGHVKLNDESMKAPEASKKSSWFGVNTGFTVTDNNGQMITVTFQGGYDKKSNVLKRLGKRKEGQEKASMIEIPRADRNNSKLLEKLADMAFSYAQVAPDPDSEDQEKLVLKKFVDYIDFFEHVKKHIKNGDLVRVTGRVEYSEYTDRNGVERTGKRYIVERIVKNPVTRQGEGDAVEYVPEKCSALLIQTALFDESSLTDEVFEELEEKGETTIRFYVPQYLSKIKVGESYVDYKKTIAIPQAMTVQLKEGEDIKKAKKKLQVLFAPKDEDKVVSRDVVLKVREGYNEVSSDQPVEYTDEINDLLKAGLISEDELGAVATVRGTFSSQLIFSKVQLVKSDAGVTLSGGEIYDRSVLVRPAIENESNTPFDDEPKKKKKVEDLLDDEDFDSDDEEDIFGLG